MMDAPLMLASSPPDFKKAEKTVNEMIGTLGALTAKIHYSAWDAGLIPLREGLEALLVLAALLAILRRTGNGSKRGWVWPVQAQG